MTKRVRMVALWAPEPVTAGIVRLVLRNWGFDVRTLNHPRGLAAMVARGGGAVIVDRDTARRTKALVACDAVRPRAAFAAVPCEVAWMGMSLRVTEMLGQLRSLPLRKRGPKAKAEQEPPA